MSRAIRSVVEEEGQTLPEVPTQTLERLADIVGAWAGDLRREVERREAERA